MTRWSTTFARFPPGRVPLVGPIEVRVADWSRPQPGRAPMFDESLLERVSLAHPAWPLAVYGPAGLGLVWLSARALGAGTIAASYALGFLAWTLLEYVAHRFSFHHAPTTPLQVAFGYLIHGVHHAYPGDSRRWVMPIVVTLPLAAAFFVAFRLALGRFTLPAFGGFVHGYLTYDLLHYLIHRGAMPTKVGRFLRDYHLSHHYATPDRHFGVSSPLWDVVFRTVR